MYTQWREVQVPAVWHQTYRFDVEVNCGSVATWRSGGSGDFRELLWNTEIIHILKQLLDWKELVKCWISLWNKDLETFLKQYIWFKVGLVGELNYWMCLYKHYWRWWSTDCIQRHTHTSAGLQALSEFSNPTNWCWHSQRNGHFHHLW